MSEQFDVVGGFDPSSLASMSQAQLLQMVNQIAPLPNIGLVVAQAGPSLAATLPQGISGAPDVTNNPRFARYVWLNTFAAASAAPTPYYYDASSGDWTATSIAALSIVNADIAANADIAVSKLAEGTAYYLIRTNAAGTSVEYVSPANIFSSIKLPISGITPNGADGFLKTASAVMAWSPNATEYSAFQSAIAALAVTQLAAGSNGYVLATVGGIPTWAAAATAFPVGSNIPLGALAVGAASTRQLLQVNSTATAWEAVTPSLQINSTSTISTTGIISTTGAGDLTVAAHIITHGFLQKPKCVDVRLRCVTDDSGVDALFTVGCEIAIDSLYDNTNSTPAAAVFVDAANIRVSFRQVGAGIIRVVPSAGGGARVTLTPANWKPVAYAWL